MPETQRTNRCSFCNRYQGNVKILIGSASGALICDECVVLCSALLRESHEKGAESSTPEHGLKQLDAMEIELLSHFRRCSPLAKAFWVQMLNSAVNRCSAESMKNEA